MTNYRRRRRPQQAPVTRYTANGRIFATTVRVVDEEGKMIGIMTRNEAIDLAFEQEKDLVLINPKAEPPVTKIIDLSKFKYQQQKAGEGKTKKEVSKTLLVSVSISDNDLQVRANKAVQLLEKDVKVKLQVKMRGREKAHPQVAEEVINKFLKFIDCEYVIQVPPKQEGDSFTAQIKTK